MVSLACLESEEPLESGVHERSLQGLRAGRFGQAVYRGEAESERAVLERRHLRRGESGGQRKGKGDCWPAAVSMLTGNFQFPGQFPGGDDAHFMHHVLSAVTSSVAIELMASTICCPWDIGADAGGELGIAARSRTFSKNRTGAG